MKKSIIIFLMVLSSNAFAYTMTSAENAGIKIVEWSPELLTDL